MLINNPRAVIWDLDGVIADTAPYHSLAWQWVFRQRGLDFTDEDFQASFGLRNDSIIRRFLGEGVSHEEIEVIAEDKEVNFRRRIGHNVKPLPGVVALIKSLAESGFGLAIVSSTPMENVQLIIGSLGIRQYFQHIIAEKDVTEGKPSPQGFLLAAERLGIEPEDCVVVEDAVAGVAAAKRAGMRCLAVTNTHPGTSLAQADLIVDSLEKVTVRDLEELLKSS